MSRPTRLTVCLHEGYPAVAALQRMSTILSHQQVPLSELTFKPSPECGAWQLVLETDGDAAWDLHQLVERLRREVVVRDVRTSPAARG